MSDTPQTQYTPAEAAFAARVSAETGEEAEFIAFKAGKMVDDKTTFEQAVDALTADRKKTTFDWTAPLGGDDKKHVENDAMNALIRGAFK